MDIDHERDPYEDAFALAVCATGAACGDGGGGGDAVLSEPQWRAFLAGLVDSDLLSGATAARFTTDFHGPRSLAGFQEQLVRWALPEHDPLRSVADAFETLEENTALVERMAASGSTTSPAFLPSLVARVKHIVDDLRDAEASCRRDLAEYAHNSRLFGGGAVDVKADAKPTGHAWQFQRDHQAFLQREERRRRPVHVERHATDAASRQVLLETFAPRLATARDISVCMASATVAAAQDEDATKSSASSARKTELVVALAVQRRLARGDDVEWLDTQVAAYRELSLSPYVQQYLGCYEVAPGGERRGALSSEDHTEHLYCFELAPTTTLDQLLRASGELFKPESPIVRYFAREIALAMLDLLDQSTHAWLTRLTPANVLLSASRRRVLLGCIEFGPIIDVLAPNATPLDHHLARREAAMLGDLAVLLFAMLFRATLPVNLATFRTAYLPRGSASRAFTSEFLVTDANEPLVLRVCRGDRFALAFPPAQGGAAAWRLQSPCPPQLRIEEQRASPLPRFTFTARLAGDLRLAFVSSQGSRVVQLTVSAASYLGDPPTRWTTLVESCACAAVPLRQLLDRHVLFRAVETAAEVDALDAALERCGAGA